MVKEKKVPGSAASSSQVPAASASTSQVPDSAASRPRREKATEKAPEKLRRRCRRRSGLQRRRGRHCSVWVFVFVCLWMGGFEGRMGFLQAGGGGLYVNASGSHNTAHAHASCAPFLLFVVIASVPYLEHHIRIMARTILRVPYSHIFAPYSHHGPHHGPRHFRTIFASWPAPPPLQLIKWDRTI